MSIALQTCVCIFRYYYYAGSSPVPPCFRAQNVIVFKRPIKMSKRQIEYLTKVPTSFNRNEDILATTPKIHDTHFEVELSGLDTEQSRVEVETWSDINFVDNLMSYYSKLFDNFRNSQYLCIISLGTTCFLDMMGFTKIRWRSGTRCELLKRQPEQQKQTLEKSFRTRNVILPFLL